ncbi:MAG TPA: cation:proton antiporter [Candidatus Nanoarchaeia archaeon]|nr:cation:proton antiporter [Candidatus Nanoarchaeia archaeon]
MIGVTGDVFLQLGIVVVVAAVIAFVLRWLHQPQILAYVLAGILLTPVFGIITDISIIESMSTIGIAFLLFLVGLEMDLKALKSVALVTTFGGLIQILLLVTLGYALAIVLGFFHVEALYIGLFLAFSSTMVVLKLLSDKRELQTLHGRIIVGILLVEDVVAILALSFLSSLQDFSPSLFRLAFLKFLVLFAVAFICSKFLFPRVFRFAAKRQELLLVSALAVCFLFSLAFYSLGFSIVIGAFLAGITLGNLEYNVEIVAKMRSLRDFFALLFFVALGMGISFGAFRELLIPLAVLLFAVVILKPLIIMFICSLFKYTKKPAFLAATALGQMGEFSLLLASQGLLLGHVSQGVFSLIVLVTLLSITLSSYTIEWGNSLYKLLLKPLKIFDLFTTEGLEYLPTKSLPTIALCGYNRIGYSILQSLKDVKKKVLIVDYNPEVIAKVAKEGYHCLYGDVTDEEILERMNVGRLTLLVSTVPEMKDNLFLIRKVREENKSVKIIVSASDITEAFKLYDAGADYVILPHFLGGEHVAQLISKVRAKKVKLHEERKKHLEHLQRRKAEGHEYPVHA